MHDLPEYCGKECKKGVYLLHLFLVALRRPDGLVSAQNRSNSTYQRRYQGFRYPSQKSKYGSSRLYPLASIASRGQGKNTILRVNLMLPRLKILTMDYAALTRKQEQRTLHSDPDAAAGFSGCGCGENCGKAARGDPCYLLAHTVPRSSFLAISGCGCGFGPGSFSLSCSRSIAVELSWIFFRQELTIAPFRKRVEDVSRLGLSLNSIVPFSFFCKSTAASAFHS